MAKQCLLKEEDDMGNENLEDQSLGERKRVKAGWIPVQAGCLTFALAAVAILIGLWLDTRLGTTPRWTVILLIASAPFALGGVYFMVRRSLRRLRVEMETDQPDDET